MDLLMKKKFDFSKFAFKEDGQTQVTTVEFDPPPEPERKPALTSHSSEEEQSNDGQFQTRSGRRVQPKVTVVLDSSESSGEENDDAFKTSVRTKNRPNGNAKPAKRKTKKANEELDISKEFVPLRKTNKSITVTEKPLKLINNKLSNFEIAKEKQTLSDEINLLLGTDDSNQSSDSRVKKRKAVK